MNYPMYEFPPAKQYLVFWSKKSTLISGHIWEISMTSPVVVNGFFEMRKPGATLRSYFNADMVEYLEEVE